MSFIAEKPVGIFYEHPLEYNPLVSALQRRDIAVTLINPEEHYFTPDDRDVPYSIIFNDLSSPTGFQRNSKSVDQLVNYTKHLELNEFKHAQGRIINGAVAVETLSNRARQLSVFSSLNIPFPKTKIVNSLDKLISILHEFTFPVLVKPNDAWKQLPILRFETLSQLVNSIVKNEVPFSDDLLLIQEYHRPKNNHVVRVETLNGRYVSAQKIFTIREPLPLWPVEYKTEPFNPSEEIIQAVESIVRAARVDVGSVEYFVDLKTNEVLFYSIRPHSNTRATQYSADLVEQVADYFEKRLSKIREIELAL